MKSTYSAVVHVPEELTALMSAVPEEGFVSSKEAPGMRTYKFNQVRFRTAVAAASLRASALSRYHLRLLLLPLHCKTSTWLDLCLHSLTRCCTSLKPAVHQ